jgi:trimeric autotransporter adhesin
MKNQETESTPLKPEFSRALPLANEKLPSSPRMAVAFSARFAIRWIARCLGGCHARLAGKKKSEARRQIMKRNSALLLVIFLVTLSTVFLDAQDSPTAAAGPHLVNFTGKISVARGEPAHSVEGITFAIYKDQSGGAPLWLETQSVAVDAKGAFTVQLGATRNEGLPVDVFDVKESRWLGVRVGGQEEQPRALLLSVPYALKAADSETLGGFPASAFMLAGAPKLPSTNAASGNPSSFEQSALTPTVSGTGTTSFLPLWTNTTGGLGNSVLFQSGSGSAAKIGVNTNAPSATLDVQGTGNIRGQLTMPSAGIANAAGGKKSFPIDLRASAFNSATSAAVAQNFLWQAEPANNNTSNPSGSLNLLFGAGTSLPVETGLKIASNGQITFAPGQSFPGGGTGVTSVGLSAPSTDFTVSGSPVTNSGTLGLKWKTAPTSGNTADAIVKRDDSGGFNAGTIGASVVIANSGSTGDIAISGTAISSSGVFGESDINAGVYGISTSGSGVYGHAPNGRGLWGQSTTNHGAEGDTASASAYGVFGYNSAADGIGIYGATSGSTGIGVLGFGNVAIKGISASIDGSGAGVYAQGRVGSSGLYASSDDLGWAVNAFNVGSGTGVLAGSATGYAAWFNGPVEVDGNLSKEGGSFKIDHPLDPANKYLYHSFVESPDMMNIYNGNVTTNSAGEAVITLPEWFEALNRDFRYQLTVLGQFAQAIVSSEVAANRFSIKTDKPNVKVSWQITGVRHDAWAEAHRIPVEEQKPGAERGSYLRPELFDAPEEKSVLWARDPQAMKQWKESRTKVASAPRTESPAKP